MNPTHMLQQLGQSVWLDFLDHRLIASGELGRLVEQDHLRGVTSNPTIFEKAIASSSDYDDLILGAPPEESDADVFERIQVREVQLACDALRPVYDATAGADGFASIEVSPLVANDTRGSIEAARRLWKAVARPNAMVKIPGTREGVPAIERSLAEGINVNVTLLFSVERYAAVADAHVRALEERAARNEPIDRLASVASFFVSRVDTKVDKALDELRGSRRELGAAERGQAAIANAKLAYERYEQTYTGERWARLAARGARLQRILWASTSPKDPVYPDLYYAEALVGPMTIDTMTKQTLAAYVDHGNPQRRISLARDQARAHLLRLADLGLDFPRMMQELEDEGVRAFVDSFEKARAVIAKKRRGLQPR